MITISCFLLLIVNTLRSDDVIELRKLYYQAHSNRAATEKFYKHMRGEKNTGPLMTGFEGMAYLLQAKFAFNPYTKLRSFNKGKALLDNAIKKEPGLVELRFMRFSVQTNAPAFLGYNREIEADKAAIIHGWDKTDSDLRKRIKKYMSASRYCSDQERAKFN